jgi:LysM repeat protein
MKKLLFILILLIGFTGFSQNKKYSTYRVSQHETISSIARKLGVTPYDLLKLNPDAKDGIDIDEVLIVPNKNYSGKVISNTQTSSVIIKQKDSIVDGFLYHTVKPHETIFSLSQKFKVSKRKVRKLNKLNRKGDISIGQVLKFPTNLKNTVQQTVKEKTPDVDQTIVNNNFTIYTVKPLDTYYSLNKKFNTTEEQLKLVNPNLAEGLKAGLVIKIPKLNTTIVNNGIDSVLKDTIQLNTKPKYIVHKVQAKEGFFRLKQLYGITKEEILKANPELPALKEGLKLGMEIKIPVKIDESLMVEGDIHGKSLNVVMMLPFNADKDISFSEDSKKAKLLNKVTDFYLGSLMALDSLKKKGLSVNVKVFDTKNSDFVVDKILNSYDFNTVNLVIAPIKKKQFKKVASKLEAFNIPVISPVSKKDYSTLGFKNSIQNVPIKSVIEDRMISYILSNVTNQNIVIVTDEKKPNSKEDFNINLITSKLTKHDSIKKVSVVRMKDGYIERELFEDSIKEDKENWVLLASNKLATINIALGNLAVFPKKIQVTLYSLSKPENLEDSEKSTELNKLHFQYPDVSFIDLESSTIKNFNNDYKIKYGGEPTDLSYKGFDTTYDTLIRLANFEDIDKAFNAGKSIRLATQFDYKQNLNNSFTNLGVLILRYNDFKLEKVY